MNVLAKPVVIVVIMFGAFSAAAQVPRTPSPRKVNREVNAAKREADDVVGTVQSVNDVINAVKDVRRTIDSVVANDKSKTSGEVHLIFLGINYTDENLSAIEEALKNLTGITGLKKVQKMATVTFEMNSSLVPFEIWKDLPKKLQKSFIVHDKDAYNVVLLYKVPPQTKK